LDGNGIKKSGLVTPIFAGFWIIALAFTLQVPAHVNGRTFLGALRTILPFF
jgi:hypothetical protein